MAEYGFFGWETAGIKDKYGLTPRDYYDLLSEIWCAETCAPRMRGDWSRENKTLGQCSITAFLLQDLFGGKVYGVPLDDGNFHCFNDVGGCVFDLTSEQFGDKKLNYGGCPEQFREVHFAKEEKRQRYELLKARLFARLADTVYLAPLTSDDRDQFIRDNQEAFNYGALEEFGRRDDHFEEDGEIISRETIERSIDCGEAYRIMRGGEKVGGVVIKVDGDRGDLDLLFVSPKAHSKGIGYAAWCAVERLHPEVKVWETVTPYFEKRNIHFYVNRCGFHIVEFFNSHHPDPHDPETGDENRYEDEENDGMFRFEKRMNKDIK